VAGKKKTQKHPDVTALLGAFIETLKAGSPTDPNLYWISLKPRQVAQLFEQHYQHKVSHGFVKRGLKSWAMHIVNNPNNWLRAAMHAAMNNFRLSVLWC